MEKDRIIAKALDIEPIRKAGISDVMVEQILSYVKAGQLKPGDKLPSERELAERFAVSRPTVREALRALSVLGVIDIRHGGGAYVGSLDADALLGPLNFFLSLTDVSMARLYEARRLIEGEICALAATVCTPEDIEDLEALIAEQDSVQAYAQEYLELDSRFHARLGHLSGNSFLARASQSLNVLGIEFRTRAAKTRDTPRRSILDHRSIVEALRRKDAEGARKAMAAHMEQVFRSTTAALTADPG